MSRIAAVVVAGIAILLGVVASAFILKLSPDVKVGVGIGLAVYVALAVLAGLSADRA